jgi:hypothetical protein
VSVFVGLIVCGPLGPCQPAFWFIEAGVTGAVAG